MRPSTRMGEPAALQLPPVESHRDKSAVAYGPDTEVASTPLCQRCQYIDFEKAFGNTGRSARPLYRGGRDIACLGRILAPDESCPLCRLLSTYAEEDVAYPKVSNASYYLYAFRGIDTYNADPMKECLEQGSNILGLCKGSYSDVGERTRRHEWWRRGPLGVIGPESSGTRAMPIDMFKIDADRARGWINSCISDHTKCSRGEGIWPPHPIQCIDCNTREIATIAFGAKYCALSYVWGASSMHDSRSNSFPRTVLDAVKVTLDLGFTYLWVDQYCINQSKSEQKKAQIQQMGDIYRCAALTLIAAAGENADAGLVGVSRPRTRQQRSRIEAADVVLLPPALPHVLESSVWNTRGWTYQEAVLSRRRLFLTRHQAYFVCDQGIQQEAIWTNGGAKNGTDIRYDIFSIGSRSERQQGTIHHFRRELDLYRSRRLSFQSDALNAFRGILSSYPWCFAWGVPIVVLEPGPALFFDRGELLPNQDREAPALEHAADTAFARGLWWHGFTPIEKGSTSSMVLKTFKRVSGLPSWSWAGWVDESSDQTLTPTNSFNMATSTEPPHAQFWFEKANHTGLKQSHALLSTYSVIEFMRARNAQDVSAVCSQALYVQSTTYTFHVRRYNDALYHTADHSVGSTLARSDKYLDVLFFTRRAAQTCSTGEITMLELFHGVGHVTHRPEKFGLIIKYEEEHAEVLGAAQIEDSFLKKCHSQRTLVKLL